MYIHRIIEPIIRQTLNRGKGILLLGARQTGKTTLIEQQIHPDISYSFAQVSTRQRYEQNPALLEAEILEQIKTYEKPIIFIDEAQKIPQVMDIAQYVMDKKLAQCILTGSSARKLKHGQDLNLLPGRVVNLTMTPLLYKEMQTIHPSLEDLLLYGSLPGIITEIDLNNRDTDLYSYVSTYLEEEIRAEALVRNVGNFARFLEIAAAESGRQINFSKLSQDVGVADTTIMNYYQILEDCLLVLRIDPITESQTKRRLIKSPKYLFFDLGVRRACANEGTRLSIRAMANLFEHYVGNELFYNAQMDSPLTRVKYWRDITGAEIDYVLDIAHHYIPIKVKWSDQPNLSDIRHLQKFLQEYSQVENGYIICRTPRRYQITDKIMALPWQEIASLFI